MTEAMFPRKKRNKKKKKRITVGWMRVGIFQTKNRKNKIATLFQT
jgi:hypothetical protein